MDHWFVGILLRRRVRFMAKSQLFKGRFLEFILAHAGAFPVRRGHRDEEAISTALTILSQGGMLVIYPEGGRSRSGVIGDAARPGIGRLALESGAPVVPVAINGCEQRSQLAPAAVPRGHDQLRRADALRPRARCPARAPQQAIADQVAWRAPFARSLQRRRLWLSSERHRARCASAMNTLSGRAEATSITEARAASPRSPSARAGAPRP